MDAEAARQVLAGHPTVLLIDFPSEDVPIALVKAGCVVHVKGGPGPNDFGVREANDGVVVARRTGRPPDQVDVVFAHRPPEELPALVRWAHELGARVFWYQSGLAAGGTADPRGYWVPPEESAHLRAQVEAAGMSYIDDRDIAEVAAHLLG